MTGWLAQRRGTLYVEAVRLQERVACEILEARPEVARVAAAELVEVVRSHLALTTAEVRRALEAVRAGVASWPVDLALWQALALPLEVALARTLVLGDELEDPLDVLGVPEAMRARLGPGDGRTPAGSRVEDLEREAHRLLGLRKFKRAVRSLRRAVRVEPGRSALHNDLGLAYAMAGLPGRAIECYRRAIELNRLHPERRSPEWALAWFNLGRAWRRMGAEAFEDRMLDRAVEAYAASREAFEAYLREAPEGTRRADTEDQLRRLAEEQALAERTWRLVTGRPPAPVAEAQAGGAETPNRPTG
ncbi:MAG: tetratricopeptide repeat protein [Planctomycetes bacterium]|nr:tetratricopeptide repeat protein [Planctomycetota bacterium]